MDCKQALTTSLGQADFVFQGYLADLSEQEMAARPIKGINTIAWQLGHLISSEWFFLNKIAPGKLDPLPAEFVEAYKRDKAPLDNVTHTSKAEFLRIFKSTRAQTLAVIDAMSPADFDAAAPAGLPPFLRTIGELLLFLGPHYLMHAGQWAAVRRTLGRPPLF